MRAYHNSRDDAYRLPYGAIQRGSSVALALDLWDAPGACVALRTWTAEAGERVHPMAPEEGPGGCVRYRAALAPEQAGILWYHFIIQLADGCTLRYGACEGKTGGEGHLRDWEPPSFQLTVYSPGEPFPSRDECDRRFSQSLLDPVTDFLLGRMTAPRLAEIVEGLRENYAEDGANRALGFLRGLADNELLAIFCGLADSELARDADGTPLLDDRLSGLAKGRLWCASLLQELAPRRVKATREAGAAPAHAGRDCNGAPERTGRNRETAPTHTDPDCQAILANAADLRAMLRGCAEGSLALFAPHDDVLGLWRHGADGTSACVLINRSPHQAHTVAVPMLAEAVSDVIGGWNVAVNNADDLGECIRALPPASRYALVRVHPIGAEALLFHPEQRLQQPLKPGLGVLAHITSLPAPAGQPGTLGAPARAFVDWLAQAGVAYWQVLPVNPTDEFGSPYAGISAFAGNTQLVEGFASRNEAGPGRKNASPRNPATQGSDGDQRPKPGDAADCNPAAYQAFCRREADWLEPYAAFMAIRKKLSMQAGALTAADGSKGAAAPLAWQDWPQALRRYDPQAVEDDPELSAFAEQVRRAQFDFDCQWRELRTYANAQGVSIVGDMPIYVSPDSVDTWAYPALFQLGRDGRPAVVAGCPPDAFAEEGQLWGNPVYDWNALRESGYAWWLRRMQRAFELYDVVRLDHFIGFARYYCIPQGKKATEGAYRLGPGMELFRAACDAFGPLPIIAEDLGSITPAVRALKAACGFLGMDVVQFADGNDPLAGYRPRPATIAYTGTHDNQTLVGYVRKRYPGLDAGRAATRLMDDVVQSSAPIVVVPLQDLLGLGDEARMNTPGTRGGNWAWQAADGSLGQALPTLQRLAGKRP